MLPNIVVESDEKHTIKWNFKDTRRKTQLVQAVNFELGIRLSEISLCKPSNSGLARVVFTTGKTKWYLPGKNWVKLRKN